MPKFAQNLHDCWELLSEVLDIMLSPMNFELPSSLGHYLLCSSDIWPEEEVVSSLVQFLVTPLEHEAPDSSKLLR